MGKRLGSMDTNWPFQREIAVNREDKRLSPVDQALAAEVETLRAALAMMKLRVVELEQLADTDTLTPLPNRRALSRELEKAVTNAQRHGEPAALLYIDLNGLKAINDKFGHLAGDAMILHVARELRLRVRVADTVARIGGDEFAVILTRADKIAAEIKAKALIEGLALTNVDIGSTSLPVGIACGIAVIGPDDSSASVLARADAAMYAARKSYRSDK
jgi:diguanylate cyclase (GGDEF)-like protein